MPFPFRIRKYVICFWTAHSQNWYHLLNKKPPLLLSTVMEFTFQVTISLRKLSPSSFILNFLECRAISILNGHTSFECTCRANHNKTHLIKFSIMFSIYNKFILFGIRGKKVSGMRRALLIGSKQVVRADPINNQQTLCPATCEQNHAKTGLQASFKHFSSFHFMPKTYQKNASQAFLSDDNDKYSMRELRNIVRDHGCSLMLELFILQQVC